MIPLPRLGYYKSHEEFLKKNKYCDIVRMLSEDLMGLSNILNEYNPAAAYFPLRISELYLGFVGKMHESIFLDNGRIGRKTVNGRPAEEIEYKKLKEKCKVVEDCFSDYIESRIRKKMREAGINVTNIDAVATFEERSEEREIVDIIKSIHNKHFFMLSPDRF